MPKFMFVYHGGKAPEDPAEVEKVMAAWNAWYGSMGDALVDGGGPAGLSKTVSAEGVADNGGPNPVSGLTIVEAADQDAAVEMAKGCPMVLDGTGSVEVAEILQM
ncbi:YCII-related domain protein [Pseudoruegeria aquimaris]|uniref:YCII-related domain protein n=1 Tax=Pseudoruegeria aquimaris TaxID=393663 RepID=A0A1Y5RY16_9RHOB|nr:YciI family protein [Pseudoruegeria aquimaris]SLN27979.1 YCII-related domain protein [Pseudoruegeria aquimaris]